jgi:hypothetical protein
MRVGGRARPPPFTISTITYKVAVYAPAEQADTLCHRVHTEWQQLLSGVHYIMMENFAQADEGGGGGVHALPQSCISRARLPLNADIAGQILRLACTA